MRAPAAVGPSRRGEAGWEAGRIARACGELLRRLGYERYGAQGGDFGAFVAPELGRAAPDRVVGVRVNAATCGFIPFGQVSEEELASPTVVERARIERLDRYNRDGNSLFQIQATRPQTLAYGLHDSPVEQLAWIAEQFKEWPHPTDALPEAAIGRDRILTNVSLYWFTGTTGSSANRYHESMHAGTRHQTPATTPTGVAPLAEDTAIRRYAERGNTIVHWSDFARGGHFAALEVPHLLVGDIRAFFRGRR